MSENQEKISRERRQQLLKRLKAEVGQHQKDLYKAGFLSWVQFLMRLYTFYLIASGIQTLYQGQNLNLIKMGLLILGATVVGYLFSMLGQKYQGIASQYARNQLKKAFFKAFEATGGEWDSQFTQADIMTVASQGIDSLDTYFQHYLTTQMRAFFNCATVLAIVGFIFPVGGLIFILALPLIPVSIIAMQARSKKIMATYWATYMDVGNLFMDDLKGLNTLYTYGADGRYERTFVEKAELFRQSTMELLRFQLQSVGYMDGVMYLGVGIAGFFASLALAQGKLSLFGIVFFVLIASEFFSPIRDMGYGMHLVMMNTKMADRIYRFLDSVTPTETEKASGQVNTPISQLSFDQISFSYGTQQILSDVTVTIPKGKLFAIAGESGRGKTTIAKLLQKRLPLDKGEIFLGSVPLSQLTESQVQALVMYVSPDSYLFNQSIYENLAMACDFSKSEILSWAMEKGLLRFVNDLPEGLDTLVGENGNRLSPGQRQQILSARALLANKPIYIFDEMTSSVDSENEQLLFDDMRAVSEQAVVLFISHKMRQVLQADEVLFLDQASTVTIAKPEELLATNAAFRQLVETQTEMEAILHV